MASGGTKYGAFAGVFTPSVLTILGVIMYLRLGIVVGEAGLYWMIAIVLISHVISISTGLSVSSISTDKRVKAGGIYYILSRSLGLPIGGAIGITLFVGTALSIAMYVIGFAESFINFFDYGSGFVITDETIQALKPIDSVYNQLTTLKGQKFADEASFVYNLKKLNHPEIIKLIPEIQENSRTFSTNDLRLTGFLTLVGIITIALISTSFAIKTQFFILTAIVLSLLAIFLSAPFFFDTIGQYTANSPSLEQSVHSRPLEKIFSIFFPAVTGFTAGVAMSGDLKDPKKDIPKGTIWAIAVGLVVYLGLSTFLAFLLDNTALRTNKNLLKEIAVGSPLFVIAGIWGATLSSALGGILGAPRILQALSVDKVTPKLFAKGVGKDNEPRNALILTFLIASVGVAIGELDKIADLVTMFYLSAYGFINLSCALESWASSDFRPTFKIPNIISVIGAVSTFFVMVFINLPFMLVASVVIGLIFFFLTKRQLSLGFGDVWQGVWSSIIRRGLHDMVQNETQQRNWRPNIILFSGAKTTRPHLTSFGKVLAGRLGFLTAFQLIEEKEGKNILPKSRQLVATPEEEAVGVFFRRQYCQSVYEGIENIARSYGFSGIEPNTVLMGWGGKNTKNPTRFAQSISSMIYLDYNVLLLHYHPDKKFGKKLRIDIWWRGAGGNAYLMLMLLKFILSADEWRKATVRILIANNDHLRRHELYKNCEALREEMRIEAEIKIINNEIAKRPFNEIIKEESENTDLVMLGMPPVIQGKEMLFIDRTNALIEDIGTSVMLVKESSYFSKAVGATETPILLQPINNQGSHAEKIAKSESFSLPKIQTPIHADLANLVAESNLKVRQIIEEYSQNYTQQVYEMTMAHTLSLQQLIHEQFEKIIQLKTERKAKSQVKALAKIQVEFLKKAIQKVQEAQAILNKKEQCLSDGNIFLREQTKNFLRQAPEIVNLNYDPAFFNKNPDNEKLLTHFSVYNQLNVRFFNKNAHYKLKFSKLLHYYLKVHGEQLIVENYRLFENTTLNHTNSIQNLFETVANSMELIEGRVQASDFEETILAQKEKLDTLVQQILAMPFSGEFYKNQWLKNMIERLNLMVLDMDNINVNQRLDTDLKITKVDTQHTEFIQELPSMWSDIQHFPLKITFANTQILLYRKQLRILLQKLMLEFDSALQNHILQPLYDLENYLDSVSVDEKAQINAESLMAQHFRTAVSVRNAVKHFLVEAEKLAHTAPTSIQIITEGSFTKLSFTQREEIETIEIALPQLFDYLINTYFEQQLSQYERQLTERFQLAKSAVQDIRWLLAFSLERQETRQSVAELIEDAHKKAKKEIYETEKLQKDIHRQIDNILADTFEKLSSDSLPKFVEVLEKYERHKSKSNTIKIDKLSTRIRQNVRENLTNLRYKQSEGELRVRKLTEQGNQKLGENSILNLIDEVVPDMGIYNSIPLYYKQLFTYKHNPTDEFWFGRERALKKADKAFRRFMDGYDSTTAIIGKPNSGKSFLSSYIARRYFEQDQIFTINPPDSGSINPKIFGKVMEHATRISGNPHKILEKLPTKSTLVFNSLELWWQRSPDGFMVLDTIFELIDRYADKHFFIFNLNEYAFQLINSMQNTENYFLNVIRCEPFNAQELKEIILFRHRSSPLKFSFNGKPEQEVPDYELAGLFTAHFNYSKGNIGAALHSWLRHIEKANDDALIIRKPVSPKNASILRLLSSDDCLMIMQLLLHKQLTIKRLNKIFTEPQEIIMKRVGMLKRIGIIQNKENGIVILNSYLTPYLIDELVRRHMILG